MYVCMYVCMYLPTSHQLDVTHGQLFLFEYLDCWFDLPCKYSVHQDSCFVFIRSAKHNLPPFLLLN